MKKLTIAAILALSATTATVAYSQTDVQPEPKADTTPAPMMKKDGKGPHRMDGDRQNMKGDRKNMKGDKRGNKGPQGDRKGPRMGNMGGMQPMMKRGGFVMEKVSKISDSKNWKDDQLVVLEGNIVKQVGHNDYVFKGETGELTVEISRPAFGPMIVDPSKKVKVLAEVDTTWKDLEVEVVRVMPEKMPMPPKAMAQGQRPLAPMGLNGEEGKPPVPQKDVKGVQPPKPDADAKAPKPESKPEDKPAPKADVKPEQPAPALPEKAEAEAKKALPPVLDPQVLEEKPMKVAGEKAAEVKEKPDFEVQPNQ